MGKVYDALRKAEEQRARRVNEVTAGGAAPVLPDPAPAVPAAPHAEPVMPSPGSTPAPRPQSVAKPGFLARLLRRQRANIPEMLEMETFPFERQPKLDRRKIMSYYDSFDYMTKRRSMVWLGPTGCGKSGLATAFLLQAIDRGHRGYFITFPELLQELFQSLADRSDAKLLKRYAAYDCLVIDEVGYVEVEPAQVGQFFTLMHKRHKQKTTIITSNLGFAEWGSFLHNKQLPSALIDRLTENSYVINMKSCKSLRDKLDE